MWLVAVKSMVGGGGKKRVAKQTLFVVCLKQRKVAVFGEHDCQTNIVCYPYKL